jgi:hypothetical protein
MDAERLGAIRTRVEQATPGPWRWDYGLDGHNEGSIPCELCWSAPDYERTLFIETSEFCWNDRIWEDAEFIAAARQDVPDLLAEVERLTAENLRLTSELNLARGRFEGAVMAAGWERATTGESR